MWRLDIELLEWAVRTTRKTSSLSSWPQSLQIRYARVGMCDCSEQCQPLTYRSRLDEVMRSLRNELFSEGLQDSEIDVFCVLLSVLWGTRKRQECYVRASCGYVLDYRISTWKDRRGARMSSTSCRIATLDEGVIAVIDSRPFEGSVCHNRWSHVGTSLEVSPM